LYLLVSPKKMLGAIDTCKLGQLL